jgi:hypothetical protein
VLIGEGGKGYRGGTKSYDSEKAWSSINHSILCAFRDEERGRVGGSHWQRKKTRFSLEAKF